MRVGPRPLSCGLWLSLLACAGACQASVSGAGDGGTDAGPGSSDGGAPSDAGSGTDAGGCPMCPSGFTCDVNTGQCVDAGTLYVTSLTKDGITWTFSAPVASGQFVTGDYYVVGPVTVTEIDPAPTRPNPPDAGFYENGSVLNLPTPDGKSAFDQKLNDGTDESYWFNAADRVYPPLTLHAGDALVSSISLPDCTLPAGTCSNGGTCGGGGECQLPETMREGDNSASPVGSISILTVLPAPVTADAFRPSYCDRSQTLYYASNLQRSLLPSLSPPPAPAPAPPPLSTFEGYFRRPWIDMDPFLFDAPAEYMPSYGMHVALADSYVGLLLELNFPPEQKVNLTNYFVQYGIDLYGCVQAGYGWPAFGGHRSGRKFPILLAGMLLGNDSMKNVSALYPNRFGEDMQTAYIDQIPGGYAHAWNGATVVYAGHYGVADGGIPVSPGLYGPYEQLPPAQWPLITPTEQLGESYRRCCTSIAWVGEALAVRILDGGQATWNYPPFFDYVDRWMNEPNTQTISDTQCVADIKADSGFDYSANWEAQGQTQYWLQGEFPQASFVDDMWNTYR
jgi:hypothetical protein